MLKAPEHQVAGHGAQDGALGPLVDGSGRFYKPLQKTERGMRELSFYSSISSDSRLPDHIRRFFPVFYGTQIVEASDGSGPLPHLVLEDVVAGLRRPSVMDIKVGSRTWYPQASEEYIQKNAKRDEESTTLPLGFRISGWQVCGNEDSAVWKPRREHVRVYGVGDVRMALRKFVSSNPSDNSEPDCALASVVIGGSNGILAQLLELKSWFEDQTLFHFFSVSVLMFYDKGKEKATGELAPTVKLIDFAHVFEGEGVIDHIFLGGLCSLIKFMSEILTSPNACVADANHQESTNRRDHTKH